MAAAQINISFYLSVSAVIRDPDRIQEGIGLIVGSGATARIHATHNPLMYTRHPDQEADFWFARPLNGHELNAFHSHNRLYEREANKSFERYLQRTIQKSVVRFESGKLYLAETK